MYVAFTIPDANDDVVMLSGAALIDMLRLFDFVALLPSVTCTVNVYVPDEVGIPEMMPVELSSFSPEGRLLGGIDQVYGPFPPVACNFWLYVVFTVPDGRDVVVIFSRAEIVMLRTFVLMALLASLTSTVKVDVPTVLGEPDITPVDPAKDNPHGKLPAVIDHEYVGVPPVARSAWL